MIEGVRKEARYGGRYWGDCCSIHRQGHSRDIGTISYRQPVVEGSGGGGIVRIHSSVQVGTGSRDPGCGNTCKK